ncbi:hypothetical protein D3C81_1302330 [compost metagenome]
MHSLAVFLVPPDFGLSVYVHSIMKGMPKEKINNDRESITVLTISPSISSGQE